jgi:putative ABC transport system permease protein
MNFAADLGLAMRSLSRAPGFTAAGVLTLSLGLAATTTIFSVVYGVLLRPLPYRDAAALVVIQGEKLFSSGPRIMNYSPVEFEEFAAATTAFSSIAISGASSFTLRTEAGIEPIAGDTVSKDFFRTLAATPLMGRGLDGQPAPDIVISERLWRRHFGAAPDVLGMPLTLANRENVVRTYTVVGVMPSEFQYPHRRTDVWRTLEYARAVDGEQINNRNAGGYYFIARRRDGIGIEAARQDAARANRVLEPHFNPSRAEMRVRLSRLGDFLSGDIGPSLWVLLGVVTLVLLVACANVANLILARQAAREREISMRLALGAPRWRLIGCVLAESMIIATAGGLLGVAIAFAGVRILQWIQPVGLPGLDAVAVDVPVLMFALAVSLAAAIAAGAGPALIGSRTDATLAMRSGSRGTAPPARRARSVLIVFEIAATIVLLVGAGLLSRSLAKLVETDLGVTTENVVTAQLDLSLGRSVSSVRQTEIAEALAARVAAIPSVEAVGFGTGLPPTGEYMRVSFVLTNAANDTVSHIVTSVPASPGYFEALRIPLLKGRLFGAADTAASSLSVILNREAARRFFGDDDPIGRTLPIGKQAMTVVGVVGNVKYTGVASPDESVIYRPFGQSPFRLVILVARTAGEITRVASEMRQIIRSYDPDINIGLIQPLDQWVSDATAQPRSRALLMSMFAAITLALSMIGLYGVIACSTAQRTTEIGVRMALGARRADVVRMVIGEGSRLSALGVALGLAAAYWWAEAIGVFLYRVTTTDVASFAGAAASLFVVALVAMYVPAARAARVDPSVALRAE